MTDVSARSRKPGGAPAKDGGQFATEPRSTVDIQLDAPTAPSRPVLEKSAQQGMWFVDQPNVEEVERRPGIRSVRMKFVGDPDKTTVNQAVVATWFETPEDVAAKVGTLCRGGKPMTVLTITEGGTVNAIEGRGGVVDGKPMLMCKGSSTKGWPISKLNIVDVAPGYGHQEAFADAWHARKNEFPLRVKPFDTEGIPTYAENANKVAAVYLMDHPGFGPSGECATRGCLFFAVDRSPDNDIVDGYFWAPGDSGLTSERGSFYTKDLAKWGGRVANHVPGSITYGSLIREEYPTNRGEAYRMAAGLDYHRD